MAGGEGRDGEGGGAQLRQPRHLGLEARHGQRQGHGEGEGGVAAAGAVIRGQGPLDNRIDARLVFQLELQLNRRAALRISANQPARPL